MPFTDSIIVFLGEYLAHILGAAFLVFWWENRKRFPRFLIESVGAVLLSRGIITESIRFFWDKPRPFVQENFTPLIEHTASPSFPSGHAAFFFALGGILYAYNKPAGIAFLLTSGVLSASRVLAGVHWTSDVLAGGIIGLASAFIILRLSRKFQR